MSISNLSTSGIKTFQDINVDSITCQTLNTDAFIGDDLRINSIEGATGNSSLNIYDAVMRANSALPSNGGTNLYFNGDVGAPVSGEIIFGNNTGWGINFSNRIAGVNAAVYQFFDNGQMYINNSSSLYVSNVESAGLNANLELRANGTGNILLQTNKNLIMDGGSIVSLAGNLILNPAGASVIECQNGLTLPTSGGTPSTLDFYEVYNYTSTFSGPWAAPSAAIDITVVRVGSAVSIFVKGSHTAVSTVGGFATSDTALPIRFRPSLEVNSACTVGDGSVAPVQKIGTIKVSIGGVISFGLTEAIGYTGGGGANVAEFWPTSISYTE